MLKVSDAFNSAFAAPDRELRARVTIGKTVYDSDDLTSINYDSGAMTGEQFSIGSTYMNSAKIIFSHLVEGLKQLDEVLVEFGVLKPDGTVEYVKMGTFIVDDKIQMDRNNNTTTIECMDRMTMLGGTYVSKLTYPARIKDVAIEIANMAGVKANETSFARLSENKINQPTGYTYRDAIGLIAQFQMGFALFDRDGLLDIRTLQDNSFKIDPNQYFLKGLVKNETFFKLNGISCTVVTTSKDENGNETSKTTVLQSGSSSGAQIKLANNVMTQDVLDRMYEALKFTNYYPFSLNWNGNPAVEAGDWLTVEDLQGNEFKVPNMSYTLTYNGGLTTTSKADTSVSSPATYSYGGSMSNIVNEIGGREGAEGNHIYEGTEDQKPLFPKEGDLWYKHVGPDTEEWIYKDGKWEFLTSTKTANDAADAADKASKEAEEAKKQANKAVDGANDAVAKAGFANDTATQAKSDAAAAGQQAKDALTSAGTAITDARNALTNSSSAQADSAQARKDSATAAADAVTAKNDAATALTDAKNSLTNSNSAMVDSAQARKDSATAIKDAADSLTSAKDAINKVGNLTTSVTSQFTTVNNELKSKVNQTDYDKLKGTVTSQQTEINQNASGINLKADKSYADTINNSVVKNTSSIGLLNNQIALTVSKAELNNTLSSYATQTWTQGQIKTTADQINLSVTKVDSKIENLTTGAPNLLRNTSKFANGDHWGHNGSLTINKHVYWKNGSEPMFVLSNNTTTEVTLSSERVALEAGADYTIQFDAFANYFFTNGDVFLLSRKYGSSNTYDTSTLVMDRFKLSNGGTKHLQTTFKVPTGMDEGYIRFDNNSSSTAGETADMWITNIKFAKENKPSPYAPAPEDLVTDVEFAELAVKVDGITATVASKADKTQITQLSDQIKLKADTTAVNTLKGTVDKQGSEITLNTNSIKLKADQSSVNTLKGTVDKQGSAIDVNTKAIALKASQSTVDTLTGRVSTAEGKITVQADQIVQTVSKTELTTKLNGYATQTWTQSQIKSTADQINLSVSKVNSRVDNIATSDRNLLAKTSTLEGSIHDGGSIFTSEYLNNKVAKFDKISSGFKDPYQVTTTITPIGSEYTLSFYARADNEGDGFVCHFYNPSNTISSVTSQGDVTDGSGDDGKVGFKLTTSWKRYWVKWTQRTDATTAKHVIIGRSGPSVGAKLPGYENKGATYMSSPMLVEGNITNKAWTAAPEDMATVEKLSELQVTVNGIQGTVQDKADQSQVTQLTNSITSVIRTASQQNMLVNSNFVKDTEGWIFNGPYTAVARDSIYSSYQSTQGIRLSSLENKNPDSYHGFTQQNISANEGTRVSYSSMIRVHTFPERRVYIELLAFDKNNTRIGSSAIEIPKTLSPETWTYFKKDNVFLPTGTTHISLGLEIQGAGDISMAQPMLTQDTEVGPYTPDQVSQTQLTQIQQTIEGVQTTVKNKADQSQVTQLANQISLKADTTALNELKGTVDKQGSEITLNTNSIKLKADQSSVDTLKGTVDKQGSAIDVNTKAIALKASQSTVDTLTGRVSTAEGKITVQADQIALTVSKTELTSILGDYATETWTQSQIKSTADSINLNVSKVQTDLSGTKTQFAALEVKVNGIQTTVSGKADQSQITQLADQITSLVASTNNPNLIPNSGLPKDTLFWRVNDTTRFKATTHAFYTKGSLFALLAPQGTAERTAGTAIVSVTRGATYTASLGVFGGSNVVGCDVFWLGRKHGETTDTKVLLLAGNFKPNPSKIEFKSWTFNVGDCDEGYIRVDNNGSTSGESTLFFGEVKLEKGGRYTPWEQTAESSEIVQTREMINLRVQKGDVINQINISPEGILIDGQKVHITGQTSIDNAVIKDAMIEDIKADKITAGTLNAANVNVINFNANNITTGTIRGDNLSLNLNTGEVLFQKGSIKSTNGNLNIDINDGSMAVLDGQDGFYFKNGKLSLSSDWAGNNLFGESKFGSIEYSHSLFGSSGMLVSGNGGLILGTNKYKENVFVSKVVESGISITPKGVSLQSEGTASILAGTKTTDFPIYSPPFILVGTDGDGTGVGNRIKIYAEYVHIPSAYRKTASGSANVIVAADGALVRSTSASKYKTDIIRTNIPDYGDKLLNLPTATWVDIAETKRFRDDPTNQPEPTRNFGMIAEDLADAGLEMLVVRGADGELEGINYDRIGPALIPVIAKLKNEVEILKRKLEEKTA